MRSIAVIVLFLVPMAARAQAPTPEGIEFFERKIRPVLVEHCYACHSAEAKTNKKLRGGLFLDTRAGILAGGDTGPALVPGKPADSLILKALNYADEPRMPPKGELPDAVRADFSRWIAMGAPDPRDGKPAVAKKREIEVEKGRDYWAFRPLGRHMPPAVKDKAWGKTPLDAFILARLEDKGLQPNAPLSKERLIRRAYVDVVGVPPSPVDIDAFLKDDAADAYAKLIDRLLDSPQYGERWSRHWLDVARFAESGGYEFDGDRAGAYLYRDFVIKAFNANMPFDEFVRLQVAGDRIKPGDLDAVSATGFLVAGPFPGQTTAKTRERIRYDHLDDMIATAGNAFLGLSLGCVRCHEHKYDPIPQEDYYRLIACLQNTDSTKARLDPTPAATAKAKAEFDRAHAAIAAPLDAYLKGAWVARFETWRKKEEAKPLPVWLILDSVKAAAKSPLKKLDDGSLRAEGKPVADDAYTLQFHTHHKGITALRLEALADAALPLNGPGRRADGRFLLTEISVTAAPLAGMAKDVKLKLRVGAVSSEAKESPLAGSLDGDKKTGWAPAAAGVDQAAIFTFETPVGFDGGTQFTIVLKFDGAAAGIGKTRIALTTAKTAPALTAAAELQFGSEVRNLLAGGAVTDKNRDAIIRWQRRFDPELGKLLDAVDKHAFTAPKAKLVDAFVAGTAGRDQVYFLTRGEVDRKNGLAGPGFIQVLMNGPEKEKHWVSFETIGKKTTAVEPRIALGRWLTDTERGAGHLLARVIVNRLWQHHLGRGIVATPNDFGGQGDRPTHPELLDYLATELIKNGWRLKPIHKLIMLSAVYRQGDEANDAALKADPSNSLWWRRAPRRMEAEAIRDSLLAVSGTLDATMFGPGTLDETTLRRSVYLTVKRSRPIPMLHMFDAPEAIQSVAVRPSTTVATQALALMNSPFVRQRAEKFAARIRPKSADGMARAIDEAYLTALSRRPTEAEHKRMSDFVARQRDSYGANPRALDLALTDFCQVLLCCNEFVFVD